MPREKIYKCCICHKVLTDKPVRIKIEIYGAGKYKQYYPLLHYDVCIDCYEIFNNWIKENKEEL